MVLEALDSIRDAEEKVETMRQAVKKEIAAYEQQKSQQFKQMQAVSQENVATLLQELEAQHAEQLEKEKMLLLNDAKKQNQTFRNKYEQNKDAIVDHIIERVKKVYGSQ
jgi:V/A-type H+-transporting ATPase subunit G/H